MTGGLCHHTVYWPLSVPHSMPGELGGEQFLWFLKNDLLQFHCILFSFFLKLKQTFVPNYESFNALEFIERCSEEMISFFWRSEYFAQLFRL